MCSILCSEFNLIRRTADSLFGFENQRNFEATVWHLVVPKYFLVNERYFK